MNGTVKRFTRTTGRAVETCEQKRSAPTHQRGFTQRNGVSLVELLYQSLLLCQARCQVPRPGCKPSRKLEKAPAISEMLPRSAEMLSGRSCKLSGRLHYSPCCTTIAMQKTSSLSSPRQRPGQACRPDGLDAATTPASCKLWRVFFMVEAPEMSVAQGSP
jgi:hypothetical protein